MAATIKIKNSSTASAVPTSSDLVQGELAVNVTDKRIFTENASGTVVELGTNPSILTLPDGSASAPTLTNDGDTNTGIFFPAADTIAFAEGGVEAMRIDSSGNLGLGTSSPSDTVGYGRTLDMQSGSGAVIYLRNSSNPTTAYGFMSFDGAAGVNNLNISNASSSGPIRLFTNGSERMRIDSSGNLGVGTTSPTDQVTLYGGKLRIANSTTGTSSGLVAGMNSNDAYISNQANGYLLFGTNNTERARIDSSGNLLVGTTSGSQSRIVKSISGDFVLRVENSLSTNPYVLELMVPTASANDTSYAYWIARNANGTNRAYLNGNGGLANYSANNVNLSDRREKTNFAPATSYLDKICAIPVQTFNYIDQNLETDAGLTLGVVAQDVQAVAPELVTESNWGTEEEPKMRLSVYQTDLQYALMKCIQEQQAIIETLTARITALEQA